KWILRTIKITFAKTPWNAGWLTIPASIAIAPHFPDSNSIRGPQRLKPPVKKHPTGTSGTRALPGLSERRHFAASYFLGRGGISDTSTGSNSNFGSSASGAKYAFVVFRKFLSSRSGKSGL